jgi:hypothetical protein
MFPGSAYSTADAPANVCPIVRYSQYVRENHYNKGKALGVGR